MRNRLFIRLASSSAPADPEQPPQASWLRVTEAGQPLGGVGHGALGAAAAHATGAQVIVLVPGSDALLTCVAIPSQNRQRILRALPFALEEQLAGDVEDMHFAVGQRDAAKQQVCAAVVDRARMQSWADDLQQAGLHADVLMPEVLAVPRRADGWTVLIAPPPAARPDLPATALVRSGAQAGFATEVDNLEFMLGSALAAAADKPAQVHLIQGDTHTVTLSDEFAREHGVEISAEAGTHDVLALLAQGFDEQSALNLLQGDYSRREQLGKLWRPWQPAAALLGVWLVVQGGMMLSEIMQLSSQSQQLRRQIERIYLQTFPDARKVVNPRVQMQRQLDTLRAAQGQGDQGFLELLARTGDPLMKTPDLTLRSVSYKEGQLNLDIEIKDLQALDQLKQRLAGQAALDVEIQSASSQDNKVQSRLQIQAKKS